MVQVIQVIQLIQVMHYDYRICDPTFELFSFSAKSDRECLNRDGTRSEGVQWTRKCKPLSSIASSATVPGGHIT